MLRRSLVTFALLTALCGVVYPARVTGVAQALFPYRASGSLQGNGFRFAESLVRDGEDVVGSALIGQRFDQPRYSWGRPSASGYDELASGARNLGPADPALMAVRGNVAALAVQGDRVAAARHLDPQVVRALVAAHVEGRVFGILGERW